MQTVNVYLHPLRAEPLIAFMTKAFGAANVQKFASPDGVIQHAQVTIGDTVIEMGEAHGPYQPMPTRFYLYVADVDGGYRRALDAGATSISEPTDLPYGERVAGVADRQRDFEEEAMGPASKVAFDAAGQPTKALLGFTQYTRQNGGMSAIDGTPVPVANIVPLSTLGQDRSSS